MTVIQTSDDLQNHLIEQLEFLKTSVDAYDGGQTSEAKRLATTLRVLLHDTTHSKSLLGQLRMKGQDFYDSSAYERFNQTPWDVAVYTGLIGHYMNAETNEVSYVPALDYTGDNTPRWIPFEDWWTITVIKDEVGNRFTRRDLVLTMANQDGGAHVDPVITGKYAALARNNSLGWITSSSDASNQPLRYPERVSSQYSRG
jgi:hypothetical protein